MDIIYAITETWMQEQGTPTFHIHFYKNEEDCDIKLEELNKEIESHIKKFGSVDYRYDKVKITLQ